MHSPVKCAALLLALVPAVAAADPLDDAMQMCSSHRVIMRDSKIPYVGYDTAFSAKLKSAIGSDCDEVLSQINKRDAAKQSADQQAKQSSENDDISKIKQRMGK